MKNTSILTRAAKHLESEALTILRRHTKTERQARSCLRGTRRWPAMPVKTAGTLSALVESMNLLREGPVL